MPSVLFDQYADDCFKRLIKSLENYRQAPDDKLLFRYRVSIKKIRVCLACIEYYKGDRLKQIRHQLRRYFRRGGVLRELKLYREWLLKNKLESLVKITGMDMRIRRMDTAFTRHSDHTISEIRKMEKHVQRHAIKLDQEKVYHFYTCLIAERLPLPLGRPTRNKWHGLRKNIKRVLYARHWQTKEGLKLVSQRQADFLDRLQHLFGYWHDTQDMICWVKEAQEKSEKATHTYSSRDFKKALGILKKTSDKYAIMVNQKLDRSDTVLKPLVSRIEKIKTG